MIRLKVFPITTPSQNHEDPFDPHIRIPPTTNAAAVLCLFLFNPSWSFILTNLLGKHQRLNSIASFLQKQRWKHTVLLATQDDKESWHDTTVLSTIKACPSGKSLLWKIQVPYELNYEIHCQFLQLRWNTTTDSLFLAMYSAPVSKIMEFLVKTTPNIPWLADMKPGMKVEV